MAASRERPKVRKAPDERLFDVRELRWRKKRTRDPVNAHNVGTSQQVGVQAAVAERDRRESNRASIWIGVQRPRIEIRDDTSKHSAPRPAGPPPRRQHHLQVYGHNERSNSTPVLRNAACSRYAARFAPPHCRTEQGERPKIYPLIHAIRSAACGVGNNAVASVEDLDIFSSGRVAMVRTSSSVRGKS